MTTPRIALVDPLHDVVTAAGALAGRDAAVVVVVDPVAGGRPAPVLARDLVTLDHLLDGRLTVALAVSQTVDGATLLAVVEVLRAMWRAEVVNLDPSAGAGVGPLVDAPSRPLPRQVGGPPISWWGGGAPVPSLPGLADLAVVDPGSCTVLDVAGLLATVRTARSLDRGE